MRWCLGCLSCLCTSKLKQFYRFKKRYAMTNLALVGNNKRILYAAIGAPGSTNDARMLKSTQLYQNIIRGNVIPNIQLHLEGSGEIPLCTIGERISPSSMIVKRLPRRNKNSSKRHFNKKLCSARVITENAYGMLKGR